jgi:hypothetical protein
MKFRILLFVLLIVFCGDNHIIQRAAEDYFPLEEGFWWRYASETDTVYVEVEPADTILQTECFPTTYNGAVRYLSKSDNGIHHYIKRTYNYTGTDHTIMEAFVIRIELPLIKGNSYQYRLADSIYVADQLIKASHDVHGIVLDHTYESQYGDIYEVQLTTVDSLTTPDTLLIDATDVIEYYAPGVGMVRFLDGTSEYHLIEYNIP